jgi:hypothetical protein
VPRSTTSSTAADGRDAPAGIPLRSRIVARLLGPVLISVLGGLLVYTLVRDPARDGPWSVAEAGEAVVIAGLYVAVMWTAQHAVLRSMIRRFPIRSGAMAMAHAGVQSATTAISFGAASLLHRTVPFSLGRPTATQTWAIGVFAFIVSLVVSSFTHLRFFYERVREAEQQALRAELSALRAQINPHFLFNALNSIAALARTRPSEAERVTEHLADLFRYSLRASRQPEVSFEEELESVRTYLAIEQVRFGDRLRAHTHAAPGLLSCRLPSLVLQPLVENAVKHGVSRTEGPCEVRIEAWAEAGMIHVRVRDTGPGFGGSPLDEIVRRGTGLANVRERLWAHCGADTMSLLHDGVEIRLPCTTLFGEPGNEMPSGGR